MKRVSQWNLYFTSDSEQGERYLELAHRIDETLEFMAACGLTVEDPIINTTEFQTSHECLRNSKKMKKCQTISLLGEYIWLMHPTNEMPSLKIWILAFLQKITLHLYDWHVSLQQPPQNGGLKISNCIQVLQHQCKENVEQY